MAKDAHFVIIALLRLGTAERFVDTPVPANPDEGPKCILNLIHLLGNMRRFLKKGATFHATGAVLYSKQGWHGACFKCHYPSIKRRSTPLNQPTYYLQSHGEVSIGIYLARRLHPRPQYPRQNPGQRIR